MKSISTIGKDKKRAKRNQIILSLILLFIITFSIFEIWVNSFGGSSNSEKVEYNGLTFELKESYWTVELGQFSFSFVYNPLELENLSVSKNSLKTLTEYQNKPLYIYSNDPSSTYEIYHNLIPFVERFQEACLEGDNCTGNVPIKNCNDTLIVIRESTNSRIFQNNNCVFIEGSKEDLLKLSDEFLYSLIGIKE